MLGCPRLTRAHPSPSHSLRPISPIRRWLLVAGLALVVVVIGLAVFVLKPTDATPSDPAPAATLVPTSGSSLKAPPRDATVPPLPPPDAAGEPDGTIGNTTMRHGAASPRRGGGAVSSSPESVEELA